MPSLKEYERLLRRDRQILRVKDLDENDIEAIRTAEPSVRARQLDEEDGVGAVVRKMDGSRE
jgi:hypothetical protein